MDGKIHYLLLLINWINKAQSYLLFAYSNKCFHARFLESLTLTLNL